MNTILCVALLACLAYKVQAIVCPCNWSEFNGRCYYISPTTAKSWLAARTSCRLSGGDLAVPKSDALNQHIYLAIKRRNIGSVWIGLFRVAEGLGDKMFYTVRGVEASYTNWYHGEPNDAKGIEDCVELVYKASYYPGKDIGGKWNDLFCSDPNFRRHYVCEIAYKKYDD